ncbi:MAG TPA: hypothetical protein VGB79_10545 [Allosphingosinicella sp.]|jgi:hypothetical protein
MSDYRKRCIAYHEAGHALVAVHEGFSSCGITVRMNMSGHASTSNRLPGASTLRYVSSRLRVLLAGAVAECIKCDSGNERCLLRCFAENGSANDDWRKAEEIARVLAHEATNGTATDDVAMKNAMDSVVSEHLEQVQAILDANWTSLDKLALDALARFDELFRQDPDDLDSVSELDVTAAEVEQALVGLHQLQL